MKKKVGIITLHLGFGGVELASITLANMLSEKYDVTIINVYQSEIAFKIDEKVKVETLSKMYPNKKEFNDALKSKNPIKIIKEGTKALKILYLRKRLVKKYLKEKKFDFLISSRYLFTELIGKLNLNCKKISIEHRHHNNDEVYINKLEKACNNIDSLVLVSKELTDFYKKRFKTECVYIPNSLSYYPEKYNKKKEKMLLAVGRLSKEKGFDDLIDVFASFHKKNPEWKLVIAGDGDEKDKLRKKIKDKKLEKSITLTGFLKKEELNKYYDKASIYLMTSHEESFGLVVIEAQSFGVPTIAFSSATGVLELIDKNCGIIIDNRDKEKMVDAINELVNDKEKITRLSEESFKRGKKYEFENVQKEWLKFLRAKEK